MEQEAIRLSLGLEHGTRGSHTGFMFSLGTRSNETVFVFPVQGTGGNQTVSETLPPAPLHRGLRLTAEEDKGQPGAPSPHRTSRPPGEQLTNYCCGQALMLLLNHISCL